jgi:N-carbamoyl-L-amino-acid hydrolase
MQRRLTALSEEYTDPSRPYTRRGFSDLYVSARDYLREEFRSAGLEVRFDAAANMIGRLPGSVPDLPAIAAGSHVDTVENGGRFDGVLGVISALEAAQQLQERGEQLRHPVEIIDFVTEEPSDYGASCIGSRAVAGTLSPEMLEGRNESGETLAAAMDRIGAHSSALTGPLRSAGELAGFLELHIEQGRVLEQSEAPIGIVSGIVSVHRYRLRFTGRADHAGTTPMHMRKDAFVAAARFAAAAYDRVSERAQRESIVATVGRVQVSPNAANVVPGAAELVLEVRALEEQALEHFCEGIFSEAHELCRRQDVELQIEQISSAPAVTSDERIQDAIRDACGRHEVAYRELPSGAGHDAMQMAALCPVGMIFVPCRNGVSHHPDEFVEPQYVEIGGQIVLETLRNMDRRLE